MSRSPDLTTTEFVTFATVVARVTQRQRFVNRVALLKGLVTYTTKVGPLSISRMMRAPAAKVRKEIRAISRRARAGSPKLSPFAVRAYKRRAA